MERSGFPGPSIPVGFAEENIKPLVLYYTKIQPCLSGVTWTLAMKAMLHCLAQRRRKYFIFFICIIALYHTEYLKREKITSHINGYQ